MCLVTVYVWVSGWVWFPCIFISSHHTLTCWREQFHTETCWPLTCDIFLLDSHVSLSHLVNFSKFTLQLLGESDLTRVSGMPVEGPQSGSPWCYHATICCETIYIVRLWVTLHQLCLILLLKKGFFLCLHGKVYKHGTKTITLLHCIGLFSFYTHSTPNTRLLVFFLLIVKHIIIL